MQELTFTPATVILLALVFVGVFFAVRRLVRKGPCDCGDHCGDDCPSRQSNMGIIGGPANAPDACPRCAAAADMVSRMEKAADKNSSSPRK